MEKFLKTATLVIIPTIFTACVFLLGVDAGQRNSETAINYMEIVFMIALIAMGVQAVVTIVYEIVLRQVRKESRGGMKL